MWARPEMRWSRRERIALRGMSACADLLNLERERRAGCTKGGIQDRSEVLHLNTWIMPFANIGIHAEKHLLGKIPVSL